MNEQLDKEIIEVVKKYPGIYVMELLRFNNYPKLKKYIMEQTKDLPQDIVGSARIYCTLNDIHEFPKCRNCGKELRHDLKCNIETGFSSEYCSSRCSTSSIETQKRCREHQRRDTELLIQASRRK